MELLAVIVGLEAITKKEYPVNIYSDSQYVVKAITEGWLKKWLRTGFAGGKKNSDLWLRFNEVAKTLKINIHWVKGHADNPYNNLCDQLATAAADANPVNIDTGFEKTLLL